MQKERVVFYFLLNSISLLADNVFTYYVALVLLQGKNGGVLCSIVLGMDAFFEIVVGPMLAKFIDTVSDIKKRLKNSLFLQLLLTGLTFLFALLNPRHPAAMILPLALIRFLTLVDSQLKSALPICLDKKGIIPLMQTLSLSLFSQRFILLMSSSIAIIFLGFSWFFSCSLNSLTYVSAIIALLLILKMLKSENLVVSIDANQKTNKEIDFSLLKKKWLHWNCALVFLSGVSFGSVTLILTKCMLAAEKQPLLIQILQGPTPIYTGVFCALALMMICPAKINPFIKNGKQICLMSSCIGLGLILSAFSPFYLRLIFLFLLGILNGVGLIGLDAFFQRKIDGENFVKAVAKNQAFGKAGALLSMAVSGFCIDLHFNPLSLLAFSGFLGLLFCMLLFFPAAKLEKTQEKVLS